MKTKGESRVRGNVHKMPALVILKSKAPAAVAASA